MPGRSLVPWPLEITIGDLRTSMSSTQNSDFRTTLSFYYRLPYFLFHIQIVEKVDGPKTHGRKIESVITAEN